MAGSIVEVEQAEHVRQTNSHLHQHSYRQQHRRKDENTHLQHITQRSTPSRRTNTNHNIVASSNVLTKHKHIYSKDISSIRPTRRLRQLNVGQKTFQENKKTTLLSRLLQPSGLQLPHIKADEVVECVLCVVGVFSVGEVEHYSAAEEHKR